MRHYDKYKDSGIDRIGKIPFNWDVKPLKHIGNIVLGKMLTDEDKGGYSKKPYLRAQNIDWERLDTDDIKEMWFSENELNQYRLKKDDLLFSEGGEVGRTALWKNELPECYIQNSVHKVTLLNGNIPKYYMYLSEVLGKTGYYDSIVNRVSIAHLTREKLKDIRFLCPPIPEQIQIANYLDRKTKQIDTLIEKKQKLIELLKEQSTAIINHAVTKGLDPNVPMKDSGIEWLGEIPAHWKVTKFKHLVDLINEKVENPNDFNFRIALEDIEGFTGRLFKSDSMFEAGNHFQKGDVLFNKLRPYLAKVVLAPTDGICVGELLVFRPNYLIGEKFLFYRLLSSAFISVVNSSTFGAKMPRANWDFIKDLAIPIPKIQEQESIADYIQKQLINIDQLINKHNNVIEYLKEYRTTLISDVATGNIDVREEEVVHES